MAIHHSAHSAMRRVKRLSNERGRFDSIRNTLLPGVSDREGQARVMLKKCPECEQWTLVMTEHGLTGLCTNCDYEIDRTDEVDE